MSRQRRPRQKKNQTTRRVPSTSVSLLPHSTAARAALGAEPCESVGVPGWPGDATSDLVQLMSWLVVWFLMLLWLHLVM